ncbi:kinase-like protein [Pseudovirgaria hyperparasitica]|uniref:EKC/KEOPS complex subunit BUD32 n=1 Tax=Pseudovirgaria hyperparasitica TaxID=470096 RepID=A0A6A6VT38_9PEZI|nr:kinase-like protein [Pseudovirgaria hyperparasitica]KAF2753049.1 kinase-like protein [Pseudovirgaria hyperparasitica]
MKLTLAHVADARLALAQHIRAFGAERYFSDTTAPTVIIHVRAKVVPQRKVTLLKELANNPENLKLTMDPYEFWPWYPEGVSRIIAAGASNYIAIVDESTVLKFPIVPPQEEDVYTIGGLNYRRQLREAAVKGLEVEERILQHLGPHPRVIRLIQRHRDGLLLENMANGSVQKYLQENDSKTSLYQKLEWAWQAAEGLAYIHERNVLHCDFSIGNLLLDSNLMVKLCDFQGKLLDSDGSIILDGGAAVNTISSMPRPDYNICNQKSDIFALGTAIYIMITGQSPFPGLDPIDDEHEIQRRFRESDFPPLKTLYVGDIVRKCWMQQYAQATEIMDDIRRLQGYEAERLENRETRSK